MDHRPDRPLGRFVIVGMASSILTESVQGTEQVGVVKTRADLVSTCTLCGSFRGTEKELSRHMQGDGMQQCPFYASSAFLSAGSRVRPGDD